MAIPTPMSLSCFSIRRTLVSSTIFLVLTISKSNLVLSERPTNVAYLGPSVTTYEKFNPAYRIYYVDGDHKDTSWVGYSPRFVVHKNIVTLLIIARFRGNYNVIFYLGSLKQTCIINLIYFLYHTLLASNFCRE